ncbi:hypothetical protein [Peterkaempfera sp. SMS 1(5)a]|uniref:hypothetical protein n=1 Tax=Peterkaempfera podocarpi TaxID=3232308 RepID=UPI003671CA5C
MPGSHSAEVSRDADPVIAVLLGVVLLHEPLRTAAPGGFALVLLGSWLSTRRNLAVAAPQPALPLRNGSAATVAPLPECATAPP